MINPIQYQTITNVGGSATAQASFATTPIQGNTIIVSLCCSGPNSPVTSITDNQSGNTYSQAGSTVTTTNGQNLQIFYALNVNSTGTFTVTLNFSGTLVAVDIALLEYNNIASYITGVGATGTSASPATGNVNPGSTNALVFACVVDENADGTSFTAGSSFQLKQTQTNLSTRNRIATEDKIQGDGSTINPSFTLGASSAWACACAIFKPKSNMLFNHWPTVAVGSGMSRSESAT